MIRRTALAVSLAFTVGACASSDGPPGDGWSLRRALADAIAPEGDGYGAGRARATSPHAMAIEQAYQGDVARQQAGQQAVMVSQVTIYGGRINVPSGIGLGSSDWRDQGGVATVTVAECEGVPIRLQRADKAGATTVYATRVNGIVYIGPFGAHGCAIPANAASYPNGEFPLTVQGRVQGAMVRVDAWGAAAPPAYLPYRRY